MVLSRGGRLGFLAASTLAAATVSFLPAIGHAAEPVSGNPTTFTAKVLDASMAGDIKLAGDIDRDGRVDLLIAGNRTEAARWYHYPEMTRALIAQPSVQFTTDGSLRDLDGDGDLDLITADGNGTGNLQWFENPLPERFPAGRRWERHIVGTTLGWLKDVEVFDADRDGRSDIALRTNDRLMIFFQQSDRTFKRQRFAAGSVPIGNEGMVSFDIDRDGDTDLVIRGAWLRNPGGRDARDPERWTVHRIGDAPRNFKAFVADIDGDRRPDVLYSSSEDTADVRWYGYGADGPTGRWTATVIERDVERAHTLQAADVDLDGDVDVVVGQLHSSRKKEIRVYYNTDGKGRSWRYQVIGTTGLHNGILKDLDRDGDPDLFGANFTGNAPARVWINNKRR